ncbi:MAG TPA: molybdopterin cofactor-binding domain-containing protein, partial [Alphaproteobacteria bacterium]|nr:molybdopterin cofactor-binding domain-containing protein [Alphaproteobacteria bacterium]
LKLDALLNIGAYPSPRSGRPVNNIGGVAGVYTTPHIAATATGVFSHTQLTTPYRGSGRPEASYAIERVIDVAAAELGLDRVSLRRRNLIPAGAMPFKTGLVFTYDCGEFEAVMDETLVLADWAGFERRRAEAKARGKLRGIGLANSIEVAGGPYPTVVPENAELRAAPDGSLSLMIGTQSSGQGHETAYAQIVAGRLGVAPERIRVLQGDTDVVAAGRGSGGSRSLAVGGSAVSLAVDKVIAKGKRFAAHLLEAAIEDIEFAGGKFTVAGTDRTIDLASVVKAAFDPLKIPPGVEPGLAENAGFLPSTVTFPNGCHICELEIDPATGATEILRYSVVDDVGRVMNPLLLKGQIHGGVTQGLGQALLEAIRYEPETGQLLSGSFMDYAMPRAADLPLFAVESHAVPTAVNPLGAKGAGEAGTVGALPSVINAVVDALAPLGIRHIDMPATPERIWRAIREASAKGG